MATLYLNKVSVTVGKCLEYGSSDKVEKDLKDDIGDVIKYSRNDKTGEVTYETLTTVLNCPKIDQDIILAFKERIDKFDKVKSVRNNDNNDKKGVPAIAYHLTQSFDGYIPPTIANEIGRETALELFGDKYLVQISTHTNTENIHNHIIFSAWDSKGKKWNMCNDNMRLMRNISDRICQEHGLEILEGTKDFKLVKWKDENGKTHFYEPTDRKNELIRKRQNSEIKNGDVGSYTNTEPYKEFMKNNQSTRDIVKHDIEMMLPLATSYEHLLELMREQLNYEIKDKNRNGEWVSHIGFKSPSNKTFLRDYKLDDDGMFTREFLSDYIKKQRDNNENNVDISHGDLEKKDILILDSYKYSDIDISKLSEEVIAKRNKESGEREYSPRSEIDKPIVASVIYRDKELRDSLYSIGYDSTIIDDVIKRTQEQASLKKYNMKAKQQEYVENTIKEIQIKLNALRFIEKDSVKSYSQMNVLLKGYWEKYNQIYETLNGIDKKILSKERVLKFPNELKKIEERIDKNKFDKEYMENEYMMDSNRFDKIRGLIEKYYPKNENELREMEMGIATNKDKANLLIDSLEKYKYKIKEVEECVKILREVDIVNAKEYESVWKEYDLIENAGREVEADNHKEQNKNKKGYTR